ncbi:Death-associated protein kinase 1 [Mactra antiquata]
MDGKKTKRRRSVVNKRHGSMEEKPKSTEVMNEKEKQDRMEAASVLSSLMFLPPKSSKDGDITEGNHDNDQDTPSLLSSTNLGSLPSLPGIPPSLHVTPSLPKLGRPPKSAARNLTAEERNKIILAELENRLRQSFDNNSSISSSQSKYRKVVKANGENSSGLQTPTLPRSNLGLPVSFPSDTQVPLTVLPQTHTVNKNVLKALRNAMAKSSAGRNESDVNSNTETEHVIEKCSSPVMSTASNESEKMECESTSSPLKKKDSSDTNLPLKKRRLVGMMEPSTGHSDSSGFIESVPSLGALNTSRQIENILQMEGEHFQTGGKLSNSISSSVSSQMSRPDEGYRPVQVDPRTSLMVLSDLKFALTPDEDGDLPLHIAVVHENTEVVRKFVEIMLMSGKTVDRFNKLQQTPLHLAILVNQPEIVETLLSAGANPNLLDRHGCTTIHSSVCKQFDVCMDTVFRTSKTSINLNCRDYEGYYPLHTCVELNNIGMLRQLIQQGADVNAQDGKAGRSVLMYAVEYNRCDIVQYLIDAGGNAELHNYAGVTPLMVAQAGKMDVMVNILNKALDIVKVEEPQFIPKKMPISRVFSRSDTPESHHAMITNGVPLVYEEYDRGRRESNSEDSRPVSSRHSSTSSPIDLSMRGPSTQSQSTEYVVRGRPPRKKGKREKGHREKHSMKSDLSEKHASIVAALEHKSKTEKSSESKIDNILESDRNVALKERSNALKSFILNAYAKQLMNQAYRMQFKTDYSWKNPINTSNSTEHESKKFNVQNIETIKSAEAKRQAFKIAENYSKQQPDDLNRAPEDNTVVSIELIDSKLDKIDKSNCIEMEEHVELDIADKKDENEESMDVRNSPEMPVLSRATSECNDSNDNVLDEPYTSITSEPDSSTSPVLHDVQMKSDHTDHQDNVTVERLDEDNSSRMNTEVEHLEPVNNHSSIENTCDLTDNIMNASIEYKDTDSDVAPTEVQTNNSNYNPSDNDHECSEEITKHSDGNEDSNVESNCLSSSSKTNGIDDDCKVGKETFVHHSDDSMEVELSESDKNKISSENIKLRLNRTIEEKGLNDKVSKIVESSRSCVDETNLVMDLDEGESELVIDETHTEEELETNKETSNVENADETVKDDNAPNEKNTSENIAESNVLDTGVVVSDGIKKQKQTSLSSIHATENIGLTEMSSKYTSTNISKEVEVSKDGVTDETKTDGKKLFPQSMKIVESSSEKSKTVPVSLVDSLLKTGQSHVLYYHDGGDYKPVRIFIDNSEQSSLVLKQMMQSAQFSTINSDESSTSNHSGFNDLSSNLPFHTNISKTITKESIVNADHSISHKGSPHPVLEQGNIITDTISVNAGLSVNIDEQNSSYQDAFVKSLKSKSGTDSRKISYTPRLNKRKSSPDQKKSDYSLNKSHTDSVKHKKKTVESEPLYSDADSTVQTSVSSSENVSKSIPTMLNMIGKKYSGGQNMPGKSLGLSSIKTLYNEGTLTRVNPDIKSRLSKALQSSQRKTGPDRKDSESFSYGGVVSTFDAKYIPEVISTITATTDTRQQM